MRLKESHHSFTSTSIIAWITASRAFFLNVIFLQWGAEHLANYTTAHVYYSCTGWLLTASRQIANQCIVEYGEHNKETDFPNKQPYFFK